MLLGGMSLKAVSQQLPGKRKETKLRDVIVEELRERGA